MKRRSLLTSVTTLAAATLLPQLSQAQDAYPKGGVVRIVVPIAAGGVTDAMARTLAEELEKSLGATVIVDNKPGGNFGIGMRAVTTAKPDGYTLGWIYASAVTTNPLLYKNLPYKVDDFQFLTTLAASHFVFAVPKDSPINSVSDYVAAIKKQNSPGLLAVSSVGGGPHLLMEDVAAAAGIHLQPIAYRGEPLAVLDLVSGQMPAFVGVMASVSELYKAGKVKVLGISSEQRVPDLPNVPTFKEQGFPTAVVTFWHGLALPAGTPRPIVDKLSKAVAVAANSPAFQKRVNAQADTSVLLSTPEEMMARIRAETLVGEKLIKTRKISVQP